MDATALLLQVLHGVRAHGGPFGLQRDRDPGRGDVRRSPGNGRHGLRGVSAGGDEAPAGNALPRPGVLRKQTRWKAVTVPGCRGRWVLKSRRDDCHCDVQNPTSFILV